MKRVVTATDMPVMPYASPYAAVQLLSATAAFKHEHECSRLVDSDLGHDLAALRTHTDRFVWAITTSATFMVRLTTSANVKAEPRSTAVDYVRAVESTHGRGGNNDPLCWYYWDGQILQAIDYERAVSLVRGDL